MAYSQVSGAHAVAGNATQATTGAVDTTGETLEVGAIVYDSGKTDLTVSNSTTDTVTLLTEQANAAGFKHRLWYVVTPTANAAKTASGQSSASSFQALAWASYAGSAASPFGAANSAATGAGATTIQPGSITPSEDNCLVVTCLATDSTLTPTINGGFTIIASQPFVGATNYGIHVAYLIQTTAAAANPTWTLASGANVSAQIGWFKAGAAAGVSKINSIPGGLPNIGLSPIGLSIVRPFNG